MERGITNVGWLRGGFIMGPQQKAVIPALRFFSTIKTTASSFIATSTTAVTATDFNAIAATVTTIATSIAPATFATTVAAVVATSNTAIYLYC